MGENKIWFSHPEELAKLAAAVSHGKSPAKAVAYALALCRESVEALNNIALEEGGAPGLGYYPFSFDRTMERLQKSAHWKKIVPKAERFPATFDGFFRLIVKAKTPSDCNKRMRDFLCQVYFPDAADPLSKAAAQIKKIKDGDKQGGYFTETRWEIMGGCYLDWWKKQLSEKSRQNAAKRQKH